MFKKRVSSLILAVVLLAVWVVPVAADKPNKITVYFPPIPYLVTDCSEYGAYEFKIYDAWDETDLEFTFYDRFGDVRLVRYHTKVTQTYTTVPDTGKSLTFDAGDLLIIRDLENNIWELRGIFQKIIIPGTGPIFMDIGRKLFYAVWAEDGSLQFELIENAGPTSYTSMNFKALCDYLAP